MKRMILMEVMVLKALTGTGQKGYGDRPGWTAYTTEDEFTGKQSHYMRYYDQQLALAATFFLQGRLGIAEWYDGRLYFDVTFDAVMEHRGHIAPEEIDYEMRVTLPKGETSEDGGTVKLSFMDVEKAGETFLGTFVVDADPDEMKRGTAVAVRWYDPIRGKQVTKKIPLAGFTRCYDEVLRRYGVKRKK